MTSYNPAIPQSSDPRAQSQRQILANFQAINTVFSNNHYPLNGNNNDLLGRHNLLTINSQSTDPTTTADQTALYTKNVSSIPELFFMPNNSQTPIQLTNPKVMTTGEQQYTFVAGPFIVYGGYKMKPENGTLLNLVVTLPIGSNLIYVGLNSSNAQGGSGSSGGFPLPANDVTCTPINLNTPANSFTISYDSVNKIPVVYYFAIGT